MTPSQLTPEILERMKPADRQRLGVQTRGEAEGRYILRSEKELQKAIASLLRLRNIPFINPSMCKRSELPIGWPDFTIFLPQGRTVFMECKIGKHQLEKMQALHCVLFLELGYAHYTVRTLDEARKILDNKP